MAKTILIAGGAGFIGSNLDRYFLTEGCNVICVDNFSTGKKSNITAILSNPNFTCIEADVCDMPQEVLRLHYDTVVNLASPASPTKYQELALETLAVGSTGTANLLEIAKRDGARFLQASTSEVYGDPQVHPQKESYYGNVNSYGPRSMYDESKRFAEALVYSYREKFDVNTAVVRIFNTYGPYMDPDDGRVVSNLITQALRGEPLSIYGSGEQTRSFCYVDDLVIGIVALINSPEQGPMNIGNPTECTMLELAELIQQKIERTILKHLPLPKDDPQRRCPDIGYAQRSLRWQPSVGLSDGLDRTIAYFQQVNRVYMSE